MPTSLRTVTDLARPWVGFELGSALRTEKNPSSFTNYIMQSGDWDGFFDNYLKIAYDYGFRVFMLHRPVGENDGGVMDFDARVDLLESGHETKHLVSSKELNAFLKRVRKELTGAIICPYFGSMKDSDLEDRLAEGNLLGWLDRMRRSMIPWLNYDNVYPIFDNASLYETEGTLEVDDPNWQMVSLIESMLKESGRSCLIEALPNPIKPEQHFFNSLCLDRFWLGYKDRTPNWKDVLKAPILVRWFNGHAINTNNFENSIVNWSADTRNDGWQYCISWGFFTEGSSTGGFGPLIDEFPSLVDFQFSVNAARAGDKGDGLNITP